ncbi:transglycosylase SLT domain-containing protein [bacterium]|nr:transglycosylase SLT domain-containing protein [bacterium]
MKWTVILILIPVMIFCGVYDVLYYYLPEDRARLFEEILIEEHEMCSAVDPVIVLAIIGAESGYKNIIGDNGAAIGYMQLHQSAVWYVATFYPDVRAFYSKLDHHSDLIYFPAWQIRIGYRYLCLLTRNSGGNILKALERYNGSKEYVIRVLNWLQYIYERFVN